MTQKKRRQPEHSIYSSEYHIPDKNDFVRDHIVILTVIMILTTLAAYTAIVVFVTMIKTDSFVEYSTIKVGLVDTQAIEPESVDESRPSNGVTFMTFVEYEGHEYSIDGLETYEYVRSHPKTKSMVWQVKKTYHRKGSTEIEFIKRVVTETKKEKRRK